jgi:hypothetical protein
VLAADLIPAVFESPVVDGVRADAPAAEVVPDLIPALFESALFDAAPAVPPPLVVGRAPDTGADLVPAVMSALVEVGVGTTPLAGGFGVVEPTPGEVLRGSAPVEEAVAGFVAFEVPVWPAALAEPIPWDVDRGSPAGRAATVVTTARDVAVRAGFGGASGSGVGSATDCLTSLARWSSWTAGVCWSCSHSRSSIASISTTELSLSTGGVLLIA